MSCILNTYDLLVSHLGEEQAYKLCETLGGTKIAIPKKAHKTYRIRRLVEKAMPLIKKDSHKKSVLVKKLSQLQGITTDAVCKIIREVEYGK